MFLSGIKSVAPAGMTACGREVESTFITGHAVLAEQADGMSNLGEQPATFIAYRLMDAGGAGAASAHYLRPVHG